MNVLKKKLPRVHNLLLGAGSFLVPDNKQEEDFFNASSEERLGSYFRSVGESLERALDVEFVKWTKTSRINTAAQTHAHCRSEYLIHHGRNNGTAEERSLRVVRFESPSSRSDTDARTKSDKQLNLPGIQA